MTIISKKHGIALISLILVALVLSIIVAYTSMLPKKSIVPAVAAPSTTDTATEPYLGPYQVTMQGTITCLPHRGTGPSTLECAYGLKTPNGDYYGLDAGALAPNTVTTYNVGTPVILQGTLVMNSDMPQAAWSQYDIKGVIALTSIDAAH